jgi:ABC-type glycerol-3-phosphate transport system substrate-binding protein
MIMAKKSFAKIMTGMLTMSLVLTACGTSTKTATDTAAPASTTGTAATAVPAKAKNVSFSVVYATGDVLTKQAMADSIAAFMKVIQI